MGRARTQGELLQGAAGVDSIASKRHVLQDAPCVQGAPVGSGTLIRLQHAATRKWLHSHHFSSPLSGNQEVRS